MPARILIIKIREIVFFDKPSAPKNGIFQIIKIKSMVYSNVKKYSIKDQYQFKDN